MTISVHAISEAPATGTQSVSPSSISSIAAEIRLLPFLTVTFQFGLFLVVLYTYDLESRAFLHLGIVAFLGFLVHYFLPLRFRRPFFAALSLVCLATVFGFQLEQWSLTGLTQAAWIVGLGLGIIAICHLPTGFGTRVALLLSAGIVLCVLRAGVIAVPWSAAIWPVLGSMFMFRTAVYLHALRYDSRPTSVLDAICYFFMLPNPCFPLFPVVDLQTFRRTYYDAADRHQIYQTGVTWLFRGSVHLLLYRFVYHYMVIDAAAVTTPLQLIQYLVWPFLLYLRVSGQFHIIVGLLHLFGFNLPETHRLYYLSSSFTDFWRRINIYWKDFMMKMVFYPVFFRVRQRGETTGLVIATAVVFFATWILHAYQWFWIRGTWLLTWNDGLFWAILAVLVILNVSYERRYGRRRTLTAGPKSPRALVATALKTVMVFSAICILWSFWSAESIRQWLTPFQVLSASDFRHVVIAAVWLLGLAAAVGLLAAVFAARSPAPQFQPLRAGLMPTAGLLLLITLNTAPVLGALNLELRGVVDTLAKSDLNRRDFAKMERGYYENLLDVDRFNPELLDVYKTRPQEWSIGIGDEGYVQFEKPPFFGLRPGFEGRDRGAAVRINSAGMRDREYTRARPDGVFRIAFAGSSFVMGVGVEEEKTFSSLWENRLNASPADSPGTRYEVLNFGVAGHTQIQTLSMVENEILEWSPNAVFYFEHGDPLLPTMRGVENYVRGGNMKHYDFLVNVAQKAGVERGADPEVIKSRLRPYHEEILSAIYRRIVQACHARNAVAIWVYLPRPEESDKGPSTFELRLARAAGFEVVVLEDVYQTQDFESLWLARWDHHPNAVGNKMIADRLFEAISKAAIIPRAMSVQAQQSARQAGSDERVRSIGSSRKEVVTNEAARR
jgi:D-alanyl-lipoteichoic acid acyltransferase DltB (MBOAT superfamily)